MCKVRAAVGRWKNVSVAAVLAVVAAAPLAQARRVAAPHWLTTATFAGGAAMTSVAFQDALRGWAVGAGGMVQYTADGGLHWLQVLSGSADDLRQVHRSSVAAAIAAGGATVLRSLDGRTWARLPYTALPAGVRDVAEVDAHTLVVAVSAGAHQGLYRSVDAGTSWQQTFLPPSDRSIDAVAFPVPERGWACGDAGIYQSRDRGGSWLPVSLPLEQCAVLELGGAPVGLAAGTRPVDTHRWEALLLRTVDGGERWDLGSSVLTASSETAVRVRAAAISADGRQELALVGSSLYLSVDAGASWTHQSLPSGTGPALTAVGFRGDTPYAVAGTRFLQWGDSSLLSVQDQVPLAAGTPPSTGASGTAATPSAARGDLTPFSALTGTRGGFQPFPTATQASLRPFPTSTPSSLLPFPSPTPFA
jgi:photosystem II stability/assembly factor-like uncharacterized protein